MAYQICLITLSILLTWHGVLYSLPQDTQIESGSAEISYPDANTMQINAANNTVLNFSSFNIAQHETVIVNLPDQSSQILNRVMNGPQSDIAGTLRCNGLFVLVNPSGIYVAPSANISAGSIILSTRDITNRNFIDKNYVFQ